MGLSIRLQLLSIYIYTCVWNCWVHFKTFSKFESVQVNTWCM